jgi:hypothetical protein
MYKYQYENKIFKQGRVSRVSFDKLKYSDKDFNEKEKEIYKNNKSIMKDRYRFEELKEMVE